MPLFALANAGVPLSGIGAERSELLVLVGVILGLVVGKPVGVVLACIVASAVAMGLTLALGRMALRSPSA